MNVFIVPVGPASDCAISAAGIGRRTERSSASVSPSTVPVSRFRVTILSETLEAPLLPENVFWVALAVSVQVLAPIVSEPLVLLVIRSTASPPGAPARVVAKNPAALTVAGAAMRTPPSGWSWTSGDVKTTTLAQDALGV